MVSGDTSIDISSAITDLSTYIGKHGDRRTCDIGIGNFDRKFLYEDHVCTHYGYLVCPYDRNLPFIPQLHPIPFATMSNREWGQIGTNYFRGLFALAFQAFLMMVCAAIYAVLVAGIQFSDNLSSSLFGVMAYTVILCFSLFKTGSLSKSIFNAH